MAINDSYVMCPLFFQLYITVDGEHRFRHVLDNDLDFIHAGGDIYVGGSGNTKDLTDNDVKNNFEGSIDGVGDTYKHQAQSL